MSTWKMVIHYIYKIYFLCEEDGAYYIGKRTYRGRNIDLDSYRGSGKYCDYYFNKYGTVLGVTYTKEILEINKNKKINTDREKYWVGDLWKTDSLCKNRIPGGDWIYGDCEFSKPVIQYDLSGVKIAEYQSQIDAADALGLHGSRGISASCINKNSTSGGYIWRFAEEPLTDCEITSITIRSKPIIQYDLNGNFIKEYKNGVEAEKDCGISHTSILECCRKSRRHKAGNYIWRFKGDVITEQDINNAAFYSQVRINQYDSKGNFIKTFESLKDAADSVGGNWQCIQASCNKKTFAYNYIWLRDDYDVSQIDFAKLKRCGTRRIYQYTTDGQFLRTFDSLKAAGDSIGVSWQTIQSCCNGKTKQSGGFIWKRDEWK